MYTTILCSKLLFIYLFFVTVLGHCWCAGFSLVVEQGLLSSCDVWASHGGDFCCGAQAIENPNFSSCGMRVQKF